MILPDGTGTQSSRPGGSRTALFVVAGVAIVIGFIVMGSLSPAEPIAVEETTTTTSTTVAELEPPIDLDNFTVSQIAQGEPLDWETSLTVKDGFPMPILDHNGWIYLFSTERPPNRGSHQGRLQGWRTANGESWESLGHMIPEPHLIQGVSATRQGLVALESWENGSGFGVWRSHNGFDWTVEEVTVPDLDPGQRVFPIAAGGSETMLVVAGSTRVDVSQRIEERLNELVGEDVIFGWGVDVVGEEVSFPLYGPLGLHIAVLTPDDIGLSPEEVEAVIDEYRGRNQDPETIVWARTAEAGWLRGEIPDAFGIESIDASPDGELIAFGWGNRGYTTWTSRNGLSWEESEAIQGAYRIDEWQGRLIGPSDTGRATLLMKGEDGAWEDIGPADLFPDEFDWWIGASGAGPGGIAALVMGSSRFGFGEIEPGEPPQLTSNGTTLTLDPEANSYTLETGDGTEYRWSTNQTAPDGITVDLVTAAIVFHDPDTGDPLASFSIEEIIEAENSYWSDEVWLPPLQAFALTTDGVEWSVQDWAAIGEDLGLIFVEVTETHVIAVAIDGVSRFDPTASPGFSVWSAPIP